MGQGRVWCWMSAKNRWRSALCSVVVALVLLASTTWVWVRAIVVLLLLYGLPGVIFCFVEQILEDKRRYRLNREGARVAAGSGAEPEVVWAGARSRFEVLRLEYAGYECDPVRVLRLPALADVSVSSTAWFVEAFAQAQALETEVFPPPGHASAFVAAVERAERAWRAACDAAERIRLSHLDPLQRATVERVVKLLMVARDSDSDGEQHAAYARVRSELAGLERAGAVCLPRAARAALDTAARAELPARPATS